MVARSNLLLDFNVRAGPPIPSASLPLDFNVKAGPPIPSVSLSDQAEEAASSEGIVSGTGVEEVISGA